MNFQESSVNLKFSCRLHVDNAGFCFVDDDDVQGVSCYASTHSGAKKKLKESLTYEVRNALKEYNERRRWAIGTVEGSILLVEFRYGSWGYSFMGPGRKGGGGGTSSSGTYDDLLKQARKHAEDGFLGIVWEHSL